MLRFGVISSMDATAGKAKVNFGEDGIVSGWLPIINSNTKDHKGQNPLSIDEHVACLMDEHCENGVIIGCIYSEEETPVLSATEYGKSFKQGDFFSYDKSTRTFAAKSGNYTIEISATGKVVIKNQTESLKNIISDLITTLASHVHGDSTPTPSSTALTAIGVRLNLLLG